MKRFLKFLLPLALVLLLAVPAWPGALTLTNELHSSIGSLRLVTGTAAVASADTLAVPLSTIVFVGYSVRSASQSGTVADVGHTISGSTITFQTNTDALTWEFYIAGY